MNTYFVKGTVSFPKQKFDGHLKAASQWLNQQLHQVFNIPFRDYLRSNRTARGLFNHYETSLDGQIFTAGFLFDAESGLDYSPYNIAEIMERLRLSELAPCEFNLSIYQLIGLTNKWLVNNYTIRELDCVPSEESILKEMRLIDDALSPENLTQDGEASKDYINDRSRKLVREWNRMVKLLGHEPSTEELNPK